VSEPRIVAVQDGFAFGLYRRAMKTVAMLGQIERRLGGSVTTRNWNTFSSLFRILSEKAREANANA
jgi:hypothetical protein